MPVPQRLNFLVGWASCLPIKGRLSQILHHFQQQARCLFHKD
ncbi:MAG: hypothetical protein QQW96_05455 [Tychonema bourrellyi B0820]|nr:hypothetical protein [Tychonema bourrellyi]MDQ2097078.1 hypothetical protein [Tychonema bourrellyi B0820]